MFFTLVFCFCCRGSRDRDPLTVFQMFVCLRSKLPFFRSFPADHSLRHDRICLDLVDRDVGPVCRVQLLFGFVDGDVASVLDEVRRFKTGASLLHRDVGRSVDGRSVEAEIRMAAVIGRRRMRAKQCQPL